jgi:hypothetical protein
MRMTIACGCAPRSICKVSMPVMPPMRLSRRMTSGWSRLAATTPASPLSASITESAEARERATQGVAQVLVVVDDQDFGVRGGGVGTHDE